MVCLFRWPSLPKFVRIPPSARWEPLDIFAIVTSFLWVIAGVLMMRLEARESAKCRNEPTATVVELGSITHQSVIERPPEVVVTKEVNPDWREATITTNTVFSADGSRTVTETREVAKPSFSVAVAAIAATEPDVPVDLLATATATPVMTKT